MDSQVLFSQTVPIRYQPDVLVVGGGPAGCAAAWAAAQLKKSVLLLEGHSCLGGLGTAGMVPAFMHISDGEHFLCAGFATQLFNRLYHGELNDCTFVDPDTGEVSTLLSIRAEDLKRSYDELLEESGAEFYFHSQLIGVTMCGRKINTAVFAAKSGLFAVRAKEFIDCTGDGDLSVMAGVGFDIGDENGHTMAASLCSLWSGIDWERVQKPDERELERAIEDGVFRIPDRSLPGMWKISDSVGGGNIGHIFNINAVDERSLTKGLIRGRQYMREYERYYKEYLTGFEKMELVATGSLLGIRESRRIRCQKPLTYSAFLERAVFEDEIGRYNYSVDIHPSNPSLKEHTITSRNYGARRLLKGESYGIPYGSLVPQNTENLLVAGRCMGTDKLMQGSLRVMPGCYITGQAAGAAAALCTEQDCSPAELDVPALQAALTNLGAYLPNFSGSSK